MSIVTELEVKVLNFTRIYNYHQPLRSQQLQKFLGLSILRMSEIFLIFRGFTIPYGLQLLHVNNVANIQSFRFESEAPRLRRRCEAERSLGSRKS